MSQKSNVNPDQYEQAGRDRPGEDILHERNKQQYAQAEAAVGSGQASENFIPGASPVGEQGDRPDRSASRDATVGETDKSSNSSANDM